MIKTNIIRKWMKITSQMFTSNKNKMTTCSNPTSTGIQPKQLNSIMPTLQQGYAYGHYFPQQWSQQKIKNILDSSGKDIQKVSIVKNRIGEHSGKVFIKFTNHIIRKNYIDRYNEDFLISDSQSQRIVLLPFQLKYQQQKRNFREGKNFKYPVRISNLDFDITEHQLRKLAVDFGEISHVQISLRQSGINKGFAIVYFQNVKSADEFTSFINGFLYRDRKLKAYQEVQKPKVIEKVYLQVPTLTFKSNQQLMKRLKSVQNLQE